MSDEKQKKIFSKNLSFYLEKSGKSQKEVAKAIGVIPQTFNTWCTGQSIPRMGSVQALADYFGIGKSDLIEDETSLAYRLSNLRKDHDLSQKKLADQLHVTHSQISRIESGETKNPNISIGIAHTLECFFPSSMNKFLTNNPYKRIRTMDVV